MVPVSGPSAWKIGMLQPYAAMALLKQISSEWKQGIQAYFPGPGDLMGSCLHLLS